LNHSSRTTNISEDLAAISPGNKVSKPQHLVDQLRQTWRWWLGPAAAALCLALIFADPFIGDWDGLDYTVLAIRGRPSSMALGRSLFVFYNHAIYRIAHAIFGLAPAHAYLLFKYVVVAQAPLAVIALWILTRDLTRSAAAATVAALLLACSPVFVVYAGQVMTEVPAVLLLTVALIIHLRGVEQRRVGLLLLGAAVLGLGVNLRETVGFYGPWLILAPLVRGWKIDRRHLSIIALSVMIFFACALSGFAFWFLSDDLFRQSWAAWRESMHQEAVRHPITLWNLVPFISYFFVTSPLVVLSLPFALTSEWRRDQRSALFWLASVGLFANLLLLLNYSTAIIWRYPLNGLPALAPLAGDFLMRAIEFRLRSPRRALAAIAGAVVLLAIVFGVLIGPVNREFARQRALAKSYNTRLAALPRDAVMISGTQTVAVTYWRGIEDREWTTIGTGSGWPGERLDDDIAAFLKSGRRVFLDTDPRCWSVCGWQKAEITDIVRLESRFRWRWISEGIYEIRPIDDPSAQDMPDLKRLLPANRPDEVRKCPPVHG
jgi:hypothetical protein